MHPLKLAVMIEYALVTSLLLLGLVGCEEVVVADFFFFFSLAIKPTIIPLTIEFEWVLT